MQPSVQDRLFDNVDTFVSSYLDIWRHLYTQVYTPTAQKIQESLAIFLQKYGLLSQYLDQQHQILYAELPAESPYTLLFYLTFPSSHSHDRLHVSQLALPLAAELAAIHTYQYTLGSLPLTVKWLLVEQDAVGEAKLEQALTTHKTLLQANSCIMYTTKREIQSQSHVPELILGSRGLLRVDLMARTSQRSTPSHYGAIIPNAAWQLIWALSTLKDAREDILIQGFYDDLFAPEDAILDALASLPDTSQEQAQYWGLPQLQLGLQGRQQYYAYFLTPTCTIYDMKTISNPESEQDSYTKNAFGLENLALIPSMATAQLDFYLVPAQNPYDIFTKLQHHISDISPTLQAQLVAARQPAITSTHDHLVQNLQRAIKDVYQRTPALIPLTTALLSFGTFRTQLSLPTVGLALPEYVDENDGERFAHQLIQLVKLHALLLANEKIDS